MTQVNNAKPIWLDLKKEYVDDNFEALLHYIHNNNYLRSQNNTISDPFYETTLNLIRARVEDMLRLISQRPVFENDFSEAEMIFNIRLLACYLLTFPSAPDRICVMLALLYNLRILVPKYSEELIKLVGDCLRHQRIERVGITYNDIINFQKEIFAYKLSSDTKFIDLFSTPGVLEAQGRIWQTSEGLTITAPGEKCEKERIDALAFSMETGNGCRLGSFKGEQLKKSESSLFPKMVDFIKKFLKMQEVPLGKKKFTKNLAYSSGDKVIVRVVDLQMVDGDINKCNIIVETTDPDYNVIQGRIVFTGPYLGVYITDLFYRYFRKGDCFRAIVVDPELKTFSFEETFKEFLVEETRNVYDVDGEMYAELVSKVNKYFNWLGENGASISTYNTPGYEVKDLARLRITMFEHSKNYGKINAVVLRSATQEEIENEYGDPFYAMEIRRQTIRDFIESTPLPADASENDSSKLRSVNPQLIPYIIRIFYAHQRNLPNPTERLRYLANAMALAQFTSDSQSLRFLRFSASYLNAIVSFASNDNIHNIELEDIDGFEDAESVRLRCDILELLKEYGKSEYSEILNDAILANPEEKPLVSKLARLIQAANSIRETLSASTLNALKREIVKTLSIETEEDVEIDDDTRQYLGTESQTVEFKTSMVYPPDNNMQPNLTLQSNNIFKGICGFLNSSIGGTLYIGVNDQGYVTGLQQDFAYLKCKNFDVYARVHIMDPLIRHFGKEVMTYVHIDSGFDGEVAVIKVDPFPFGVVELNGVSYVRADRETREMTDKVKAQITHEKLLKDREKADNLVNLQQSRFNKCRAILHDYASSNGGTIKDREVEVYDILPEDGLAACYDCASKSCKFFSISRMNYVEVTPRKWEFERFHLPMNIDAFRTSGEQRHTISLQLDLHAKNILVERYPRTKEDISKDANDTNVWYYTGKVASPDPLTRFYVSLADHIRILDAPALRESVEKYLQNNFGDKTIN